MNNNVNSSAKIIRDINTDEYTLGSFNGSQTTSTYIEPQKQNIDLNGNVVAHSDGTLQEIKKLSQQLSQIQNQVNNIEKDGVSSKDLDQQIIQALKDLKNYATFFEQASFQLETKILKTSLSIAKKIISVEIGEQSHNIAKITIEAILNKIKTASQVTIHLNPKDYVMLKDDLEVKDFMKIEEDPNVTAGGVVIASDLGNFDGNIEAKIATITESLDTLG